MRRRFTYLLLSLCIVAGSGQAFADHNNHRGGKDRQEQGGHRQGGNSGNRNNGHSNKNHGSNKKNDKFLGNHGNHGNNGNQVIHGNNGNHGNKAPQNNWGKPGNNSLNVNPGNNHRPGNNNGNRPENNGNGNLRPGGNGHDNFRPGSSSAPRPGHGGHIAAPAPRPVPAPHPAPVVSPGAGFHYGPALPPPPPRLPYMVDWVTRGCSDWNVWQIDSETFIVKYRRGGRWYTQYLYPFAERYGNPTLISVNWQPLSPWTLIPPIQLNINL